MVVLKAGRIRVSCYVGVRVRTRGHGCVRGRGRMRGHGFVRGRQDERSSLYRGRGRMKVGKILLLACQLGQAARE